ncbi:MAG: carbohydrate ABC transporter permease [Firmicutes bacterium]|nr:carbohydrate ABC transporter permease [Bacillota bacterium]
MKRRHLWRIPVALLIVLIYLIPFYIVISVSLRHSSDHSSWWALPNYLFFGNYATALKGSILQGILNSVIITISSVALIVIFGALAAYPLARNKNKLNRAVRIFVLGVMMVPQLSIIVPIYSLVTNLKLGSTYPGIVLLLVTFFLPLSIFIFTNFIASIPRDLDEAAAIDGCGPIRTFFLIIMPQLKPVTASVIILTGVNCWNDFQFSLYLLQKPQITSVTLAISGFFAQVGSNVYAAAAAAVLGVIPVIGLFLAMQKYFIKGMVDSAVKF